MAKTINELKAEAAVVRDATEDGENTALRVGTVFIDTIDKIGEIETDTESAYHKPSGGIPKTDLASGVQTSLDNADTAYQKPSGGIPKTDLASSVQALLDSGDATDTYTDADLAKTRSVSLSSLSVGDTVDPTTSKGLSWGCMRLAVKAGDKVELTTLARSSGTGRPYVVTNTSNVVLAVGPDTAGVATHSITISADGYIYTNCWADGYSDFKLVRRAKLGKDEDYIYNNLLMYEDVEAGTLTPMYYYNLSGGVGSTVSSATSHENWSCLKTPVKEGQIITLYTMGGNNARAYALTDSNDEIYDVADASANYLTNPAVLQVEEDGFLYVNTNIANTLQFSLVKHINFDNGDTPTPTPTPTEDYVVAKYKNTGLPLYKDTLKVLAISNSFMVDALSYMGDFLTAANIVSGKVCFYGCFRSSGSLSIWDTIYNNGTALSSNEATCLRYAGGIDMGVSSSNTLKEILAKDWDVVVLQQNSGNSANYSTFEPYLTHLIGYIRKHCTNQQVSVAWQMTWSYKSTVTATGPKGESGWEAICDTVKQMMVSNGIDIIIPTGTAIQNARNTSINTNGDMTRDGQHLAYGVGRYIATATWYQVLVAPIFGKSVLGNAAVHAISSEESSDTRAIYDSVAVTSSNKSMCQLCAFHATNDMFDITTIATESIADDTSGVKQPLYHSCPIIEDTRSSAVAVITGVAPFASLVDGQRIVLRFAYGVTGTPTLELMLNGGGTTGRIGIYGSYQSNVYSISTVGNIAKAGCYVEFVYDQSNNRWITVGWDNNTVYNLITQSSINSGTSTTNNSISPKLFHDNVYIVEEDAHTTAPSVLKANKMYDFGTVSSALTIPTLDATNDLVSNVLNFYALRFIAGADNISITFPTGVLVDDTPTINTGDYVEIMINLYVENNTNHFYASIKVWQAPSQNS